MRKKKFNNNNNWASGQTFHSMNLENVNTFEKSDIEIEWNAKWLSSFRRIPSPVAETKTSKAL